MSHLQVYQSFLEFIINPDKNFMHGWYFNVSTFIKCEAGLVSLFVFFIFKLSEVLWVR